jgi:hypothetical protein
MGPAVVSPRHKRLLLSGNAPKRISSLFGQPDLGWVGNRAKHQVIIEHHAAVFHAMALGHELLLAFLVVDQECIGLTSHPHLESLAGADGHDLPWSVGGTGGSGGPAIQSPWSMSKKPA